MVIIAGFSGARMRQQEVKYQHNDIELMGLLSYPESSSQCPAVLIAPDWSGRKPEYFILAEHLAEQGYASFILDMFGNGHWEHCKEKKLRLILPFLEHRDQLQARMLVALQTFAEFEFVDKQRIAVLGYCFGGMCALDLARINAPLAGVISVHGLLTPANNLTKPEINTKVLALHGNEDRVVTERDLRIFAEEMDQANADWQLQIFSDAMHAFTSPNANDLAFGALYNPVVAERAKRSIDNFLSEVFL